MRNHFLTTMTGALAILLLAGGCSREESTQPAAEQASMPAAAEPAAETTGAAHDMGEMGEMSAAMPRTPSPEGVSLFFVTPADGATVSSPVHIEFGLEGMAVAKAGDNSPNSGHHHLLVDTGLPDLGMPIPADKNHIHFGDGSTSTDLELAPGQHTLQLLLGDYLHIPHDPPVMSEQITITVE